MSILGDLTLDDLRYLVACADTKGISAAADNLGVRQPTVSRRMDLWRACQPPLLRKIGNRDVFTDRGHHVVASARAILSQLSAYLKDHEGASNCFSMGAGSVGHSSIRGALSSIQIKQIARTFYRTYPTGGGIDGVA